MILLNLTVQISCRYTFSWYYYNCPNGYPYRYYRYNSYCYDCSDGLSYFGNPSITIANCYSTHKQYWYHVDSNNIHAICVQCWDCQNNYYGKNGICTLCANVYPGCQLCYDQSSNYCYKCLFNFVLQNNNCIHCNVKYTDCLYCNQYNGCYQFNSTIFIDTCNQCTPTSTGCVVSTHIVPNCYYCNLTHYSQNGSCHICIDKYPQCFKCQQFNGCIDCYNNYIAQNGICKLCDQVIPNCILCRQSGGCYDCNNTHYLLSGGSCSLCNNYRSFCINCHDNGQCYNCVTTHYASSGYCYLCYNKYSSCILCEQSTGCFDCFNTTFANNGQCHSCSLKHTKCLYCEQTTECIDCNNTHYAQNGTCYQCKIKYSDCILCKQIGGCYDCNITHYAQNSTCNLCDTFFPNCLYCNQKLACTKCHSTHLLNTITGVCQPCSLFLPGCTNCSDAQTCMGCTPKFNYIPSKNLCKFYGCGSAILINNQYVCRYCFNSLNFMQNDGICICKKGFIFNSTTQRCQQICGDGLTFKMQCDDGNTNNNDGCYTNCTIMDGFQCQVTVQSVYCKNKQCLNLKINSINKVNLNQAQIKINAINSYFPFLFSEFDFIKQFPQQPEKYVFVDLIVAQEPLQIINLPAQIIYSKQNQIKVKIQYDFTIQSLSAIIKFNTTKARYICQNNEVQLQFTMIGSNTILKVTQNSQLFQGSSTGNMVNIIIINVLLIIGLFSQKYIGLQCILAMQLIYYSQLLIDPVEIWPVEFQSLKLFKYSNSYNYIIQPNQVIVSSSIQKKLQFLDIKKFIFENFNLSCIILWIAFIVFISFLLFLKEQQKQKVDQLNKNENQKEKEKKKKKKLNSKMKNKTKTLKI